MRKFVVPLSWPPAAENPQGRYGVGIQLFGRLKPGVTAGQADAEAKTLEKRYVDAGPPQLKAFVCVFTQVPLQSVVPTGQTQMLPWHVLPPVQAVAQLPQCSESVARL